MAQGSFDTTALERVLRLRLVSHNCDTAHEPTHCGCFWKDVFTDFHGEPPKNDRDPLWDPLFKAGFPLLRSIRASSS